MKSENRQDKLQSNTNNSIENIFFHFISLFLFLVSSLIILIALKFWWNCQCFCMYRARAHSQSYKYICIHTTRTTYTFRFINLDFNRSFPLWLSLVNAFIKTEHSVRKSVVIIFFSRRHFFPFIMTIKLSHFKHKMSGCVFHLAFWLRSRERIHCMLVYVS